MQPDAAICSWMTAPGAQLSEMEQKKHSHTLVHVSYTHLDVYKRQFIHTEKGGNQHER